MKIWEKNKKNRMALDLQCNLANFRALHSEELKKSCFNKEKENEKKIPIPEFNPTCEMLI